jgi:arylsulfatase A-like enzyme
MMMGVAADDAPGPGFYSALLRSPFGDALTLDFARSAIAGEQLGQRGVTDILSISLSSHDYINHLYSAESRLSHDHLLQLDRLLERFFADLDLSLGKGNYVAMLTADHGFSPAPETSSAQGLPSGRLNPSQLLGRINASLEKRFGEGKWVMGFSAAALLLDKKLMASKSVNADAVAQAASTLLRAEPAIGAAYTRAELLAATNSDAPFLSAMRKAWHADVSGDVQFVLKPNWLLTSFATGSSHGSPYPYDTQVPLLIYGPGWYKPGRVDVPVDITSIAPTLAQLLGTPRPPAAEGRVLPISAP